MLFAIKKNTNNSWGIAPVSGVFKGVTIATAECIDLTSVVATGDVVTGTMKAVWGLQISTEVDVYSDTETIRALCLGKAFKGGRAEHRIEWGRDGLYDLDSSRIIRSCRRLVLLGSSIFRRD